MIEYDPPLDPGIIEKLQQEMRALEAALLSEPQASEGRDG